MNGFWFGLISVLRPFNTFKFILVEVSYPRCSWASLLGRWPVLSASNWQLLFLNQRKRENGRRIYSWPSPHERKCQTWGLNSGPLACQADVLLIYTCSYCARLLQWMDFDKIVFMHWYIWSMLWLMHIIFPNFSSYDSWPILELCLCSISCEIIGGFDQVW